MHAYSSKQKFLDIINFFHLPTWKRNFKPCWSPKSEITCSQLITAYNTIVAWEKEVANIDFEDHRIIDILMKAGIGNGMYHAVSGLLMGIVLNRSVFSHYNFTDAGLLFPKSVPIKEQSKKDKRDFKHLSNMEYWPDLNYSVLLNFPLPMKSKYLFPYLLLTDPVINEFTRTHFGIHFVYFLSNYINYFSESLLEFVLKVFQSVPKNIKILGVHIRDHHKQKHFIWNLDFLIRVLVPFLDDYHQNNKQYIFFTSNCDQYTKYFEDRYNNRFFVSEASKKEDGEKNDALIDIGCLMMCDEIIGTFRSSFTSIAGMRAMTNPYYLSAEIDYIFRFTSSQAGLFSMIFDSTNGYNYMANYRLKVDARYEDGVRAFFYYFGI